MPLDYRRVLLERKKAEAEVREREEQLEVSHG